MHKHSYTLKILISVLALLILSVGVAAPRQIYAQFAVVNPVTDTNTTIKNVFDSTKAAAQTVKEINEGFGAILFKQAGSAILNTIAAESAKAIATGDFGAPVFTFDKSFYRALADGVVGDTLNSIVQGTLGIDLCNFDPTLSLRFGLELAFYDEYKYEPTCSLSAIADHFQELELKNLVDVGLEISANRVDGVNNALGFISQERAINRTNTAIGAAQALARYTDPSGVQGSLAANFVSEEEVQNNVYAKLSEDSENVVRIVSNPEVLQTEPELSSRYSVEQYDARIEEYACEIAGDAQRYNFAAFGSAIADLTGSRCRTSDGYSLSASQWPNAWRDAAAAWTSDDGQLSQVVNEMSRVSQSDNELVRGLDRIFYNFQTCNVALNRVLNTQIVRASETGEVEGETVLRSGDVQQTIFAEIADPDNPGFTKNVYLTFKTGAKLTPGEFASCQIAFNSGRLLGYGSEGANVFNATNLQTSGARLIANQIFANDYEQLFTPEFIASQGGNGLDVFNDWVTSTVILEAGNDPAGAEQRRWVTSVIGNAVNVHLVAHETFLQYYNDVTRLFNKQAAQQIAQKPSQDDRLAEFGKSLNPESQEKATGFQLTQALLKEKGKKIEEESIYRSEKGTLLNPNTSPVSEYAQNVPETKQSQIDNAVKGQSPTFADYTGQIAADALNVFLQTLWNQALIQGLSKLNPVLQDSRLGDFITISGEFDQSIENQGESALIGYDVNCTQQELDIIRSFNSIRRSLRNIVDPERFSGEIDGVSPECDQSVIDKGFSAGADNVADARELGAGSDFERDIESNIGQGGRGGGGALTGGGSGIGAVTGDTTDRAESSTQRAPFTTGFDTAEIGRVNLLSDSLDILTQMSTCPRGGSVNATLYNCTISSNLRTAISQELTLQDAIDRNLLSPDAVVGIDANGTVPTPDQGISLSAAQKLRKTRIMPLGLEFAARLKVACYQRDKFGSSNVMQDTAPDFPYEYMGTECVFRNANGDELSDADQQLYIREVLDASLQDIMNGYVQSGAINEKCGDFAVDAGARTMSAFCGLVNPDWVMKLPELQCNFNFFEYSDILEAAKGKARTQECTEVVSRIDEDNFGYCVKERNLWSFSGQECPAQFSTCTSYVFPNTGETGSFNRDSLVGSDVCNATNAGCLWVSTLNVGGQWKDTTQYRTQAACEINGGTWDGDSCLSSRLYLNGNRELCDPENNGCSQVFSIKRSQNNLVPDGGFELSGEGSYPAFWESSVFEPVDGSASYSSLAECVDEGNSVTFQCQNVPYDSANECTARGGQWNGSTCSGAVLPNATSQSTCGVCVFTGTNPSQDISAQIFDEATCAANAGTGHEWRDGDFASLCVIENDVCPDGADCPVEITRNPGDASEGSAAMRIGLDGSGGQRVASYQLSFPLEGSTTTLSGDTYSVGFSAKVTGAANLQARAELIKTFNGGRVDQQVITLPLTNAFERYSMTLTTLTNGTDLTLRIIAPNTDAGAASVLVDAVKLEYNSPSQILNSQQLSTPYTAYGNNQSLHVKLPPDYLGCRGFTPTNPAPAVTSITDPAVCQTANYFWDFENVYGRGELCYRYEPDVAACQNFASLCQPNEAGCQLYTPTNGEPAVPGVIGQGDLCPNECVGYETFKQQPSYFEPESVTPINYFIPDTAQQCSVSDVGCDEFTNLSVEGQSPIEYYSYLRQCILPNTGQGEAGYFIWQGSADGPPQLRTFTLQAENADGTGGPRVISDAGLCDPEDVGVDLDCLRFFDNQGNSYLRRLSYTVEASEECVTLRKTTATQETCLATNGEWNGTSCLYQALPQQSNSCSAQVNGCREYLGNTGSNSFNVFFDRFESSPTPSGWYNGISAQNEDNRPNVSTESITTLGHSIQVSQNATDNAINKSVSLFRNRSYRVSFWAKHNVQGEKDMRVSFSSAPSGREFAAFGTQDAIVGPEWRYFELGPVFVDWDPGSGNRLVIEGAQNVFFDNIALTSLRDSIYVVKDSWQTPASCDRTNLGASMPQAQLGCQEYADGAGNRLNLKSFTSLCRESAIGCQLVMDTQNSLSPYEQSYNTDNVSDLDDVSVPRDRMLAVIVNDQTRCDAVDRGCMQVGTPTVQSGEQTLFTSNLYYRNNPDRYTSSINPILCKDEELGCTEVVNSQGTTEFLKIDFSNMCEYREGRSVTRNNQDTGAIEDVTLDGWFKTGGSGLGCAASAETSQQECEANGNVWNFEYSQCTTAIQELTYDDCTTSVFTDGYVNALSDACISDYKGAWFDDRGDGDDDNSCGCAKNPFDYYKANEWPERNVAAARCEEQYDQCTEFLDFNPNFIFNGDFELYSRIDNSVNNWSLENAGAGTAAVNFGEKFSGTAALELKKTTRRDLPAGTPFPRSLENTPAYVQQRLTRLEKGQTYEYNFAFKSGENRTGVVAGEDFDNPEQACAIPQAAVEIVPVGSAEYENHQAVQIFEPNNDWKTVTGTFVVPNVIPGVTDADEDEPTLDYEVRIYGPLNGYCENTATGERKYFKTDGTPLDLYTCEGLSAAEVAELQTDNSEKYNDYDAIGAINGAGAIPDYGPGSWNWVGNCVNSSYLIDNFQISPVRDHLYYFIDDGTLDKGSCSASNWDEGCITFRNTIRGVDEIIQVQPDRECSEWLFCEERDPETNQCLDWSSCKEQQGGTCVQRGSFRDEVRYNLDGTELQPVTREIYQQRLGVDDGFRISRWRAGDYAGYTIPNIPSLEQVFTANLFTGDPAETEFPVDPDLVISAYDDMCRGYPEEDSPYPAFLTALPGFENVNQLIGLTDADDADNRIAGCGYTKYDIGKNSAYYPGQVTLTGNVCASGSDFGQPCSTDDDCRGVGDGSCIPVNEIEQGTFFTGRQGVCIEEDSQNKVHGGFVDLNGDNIVDQNEIKNADGPRSCLTFFPY